MQFQLGIPLREHQREVHPFRLCEVHSSRTSKVDRHDAVLPPAVRPPALLCVQLVSIIEELLEVTASPDAPVKLEEISAKLTYMGKVVAGSVTPAPSDV